MKKGKPEENAGALVALTGVSTNVEDYRDMSTGLIQYGVLLAGKAKNDGKLEGEDKLTMEQACYLNMRGQGLTNREACELMGISRAMPLLWEEEGETEGIFNQCLKAVEMLETKDLEDIVWRRALKDGKADILRMFALKARDSRYKDNAPAMGPTNVMIRVSVDGQQFDTSANLLTDGQLDKKEYGK